MSSPSSPRRQPVAKSRRRHHRAAPPATWASSGPVESLESRRLLSAAAAGGLVSAALVVPPKPAAPALAADSDSGAAGDGLTGDATPTFVGAAAAPGDRVRLLLDGAADPVAVAQAGPDGRYELTVPDAAPLADGPHAARVVDVSSDDVASEASDPLAVTIDTAAPAPPPAPDLQPASDSGTSNGDDLTNAPLPAFDLFAAEPGGTVQLLRKPQFAPDAAYQVVSPPVSANGGGGGSTPDFFPPAQDGRYEYATRQTDRAGNASAAGPSLVVTIDRTVAAPTLALAPDVDDGALADDGVTSLTRPGFAGAADPGSALTLLIDGSAAGSAAASLASGAFGVTSGQALGHGLHAAVVMATDAAGNSSPFSATLRFVVDNEPVPNAGGPYNVTEGLGLSLSAAGTSDADNTPTRTRDFLTYRWDLNGDGNFTDAFGSSATVTWDKLVLLGVADGPATFSARVQADDGFVRVVGSTSLAVVNLAPATAAVAGPASAVQHRPVEFTFSAQDVSVVDQEAGFVFRIDWGDGSPVQVTPRGRTGAGFTHTFTAVGPHRVTVTAVDKDGGASPASAPLTVTVIPAPPPMAALAPESDSGAAGDRRTNDATPSFTGTATPGDTVRLLVDGAGDPVAAATVAADGTYVLTVPDAAALADGPHSVRVVDVSSAADHSPSEPSDALTVTIDATAPAPPPAPDLQPASDSGASDADDLTNAFNLLFATGGGLEPGAVLQLLRKPRGAPDAEYAVVGLPVGPQLAREAFSAPADGAYDYALRQTDVAANTSAPGAPLAVTIDRTPGAPATLRLDPASDDGVSDHDAVTSLARPAFVGAAEPGSRVTLLVDGVEAGTATADAADGTFRIVAQQDVRHGLHPAVAAALDAAGNESAPSPALRFIVDNEPVPSAGGPYALTEGGIPLSLSAADTTDADVNTLTPDFLTYRWDLNGDGNFTDAFGRFPVVTWDQFAALGVDDGPATLTVRVEVNDGYVSVVGSAPLTVNNAAPTSAATAGPANAVRGVPVAFTLSAQDPSPADQAAGFVFRINWGDGSPVESTALSPSGTQVSHTFNQLGAFSVRVTAVDKDGGSRNAAAKSVTVAPPKPAAPALAAASDSGAAGDGITGDATPSFTGTATPGDTVRLLLDGAADPVATATVAGDGTYVLTVADESALADGPHTARVVDVSSAADHTASGPSDALSFTIDTVAPGAPGVPDLLAESDSGVSNADNLTNRFGLFFTPATAEPGGSMALLRKAHGAPDADYRVVGEAAGSALLADGEPPEADGQYDYAVRQTDAAGNPSPVGPPLVVTIDRTVAAPLVRLDPASDDGVSDHDRVTSLTRPTFLLTTEPGATVLFTIDGQPVSLGPPPPPPVFHGDSSDDGNFVVTPQTPLGHGGHIAAVTATDAAGNETEVPATLRFAVDNEPVPRAGGPYAVSEGLGVSLFASATTDADNGATTRDFLTYRWDLNGDGNFTDAFGVQPTVTWEKLASLGLGDGPGSFTARVEVNDGFVQVVGSAPLVVTNAAPAGATATGPATAVQGQPVTFTFGALDPSPVDQAAGFVYRINWGDGTPAEVTDRSPAGASFTHTFAALGARRVTVTATDKDGAASPASQAFTITVTPAAPPAPALADDSDTGVRGDRLTNDATPSLTGTANPGDTIRLLVDGAAEPVATALVGADGHYTVTVPDAAALADGPHTFRVVDVSSTPDHSASEPSEPLTVTIDTAAPAAPAAPDLLASSDSGASDGDDLTNATTLIFQGLPTPERGGGFVELLRKPHGAPDGEYRSVGFPLAAGRSIDTDPPRDDGPYDYAARLTDPAGNAATGAPLVVTIDRTPTTPTGLGLAPGVDDGVSPTDGVTGSTRPTFTGTGEPGGTVTLAIDSVESGTVTVGDDGTFAVTSDRTLGHGRHIAVVDAADAAGNHAVSAPPVRFVVDHEPVPSAGGPYAIKEGDGLFLFAFNTTDGDAVGPARDVLTYRWDVNGDGDFTDAFGVQPNLTWEQLVALGVNDGPAARTVRVEVDDGFVRVVGSAPLTVNNAPPTDAAVSGPSAATVGRPAVFTFSARDASPADRAAGFVYRIDWGDGTPVENTPPMPADGATFAHAYPTPGVYRVSVRAVDKDGGVSEPATAATTITVAGARVAPDPTDPTQTALIVGGTEGGDSIVFRRPPPGTRGGGGKVEVLLNGDSLGVFNPTGRIVAFGRGGNDVILAESQLGRSFMLFGGAGNDTILTGNGDSVLVGGDGNDVLNAGNGRDVLIGGAGADRLTGGNGDDLLVAGATRYDGGADADLRSLAAIQFEWLRTDRTYPTRVNAIRNGGGLNGANVFNASTLIADAQPDVLLGGNGSEWFLTDVMDRTDRRAGELLN